MRKYEPLAWKATDATIITRLTSVRINSKSGAINSKVELKPQLIKVVRLKAAYTMDITSKSECVLF